MGILNIFKKPPTPEEQVARDIVAQVALHFYNRATALPDSDILKLWVQCATPSISVLFKGLLFDNWDTEKRVMGQTLTADGYPLLENPFRDAVRGLDKRTAIEVFKFFVSLYLFLFLQKQSSQFREAFKPDIFYIFEFTPEDIEFYGTIEEVVGDEPLGDSIGNGVKSTIAIYNMTQKMLGLPEDKNGMSIMAFSSMLYGFSFKEFKEELANQMRLHGHT